MLRHAILSILAISAAGLSAAADNPETMAERSQERARAVLDRAVEANGGAETLRAVKVVRLHLEGETFPRLQMTTPAPPFEGGTFDETLLVDLENNRLRLEQKAERLRLRRRQHDRDRRREGQQLRQPRQDRSRRSRRSRRPSSSSSSITGACRT